MTYDNEEREPRWSEREEIEMLLPWYATGTLDPADNERVARFIEAHPDLGTQLRLIEEERVSTVQVNEQAGAMTQTLKVDKLNRRGAAGAPVPSLLHSFLDRMSGMLSAPSRGVVRFAAVALLAVVIGQAVTIGWLVTGGGTDGYNLASGSTAPDDGTFALAQIKADASFLEISADLQRLRVTIADGPNAAGFVTLRIGPADLSTAESRAAIANIGAESDVITLIVPKND